MIENFFSYYNPFFVEDHYFDSNGITFFSPFESPCSRADKMTNKQLLIMGVALAAFATLLFWYGQVAGAVFSLSMEVFLICGELVQRHADKKAFEEHYYTWPMAIKKDHLHFLIFATALASLYALDAWKGGILRLR